MNAPMQQIIESKRNERRRLAALPFSEKIKLLERLRDREAAIATAHLYRGDARRRELALLIREGRTDKAAPC